MTVTIELDPEKAKFLKKFLDALFIIRNDVIYVRDSDGEYVIPGNNIRIFDDTLRDVIGQLSRGTEAVSDGLREP